MALTVSPGHLKRYKDIAQLLWKYGDAAAVRGAGLEEVAAPVEPEAAGEEGDGRPEELAADLERMGPLFVKLGQLLSSRPDLLPERYLEALHRLQDRVEPFPFDEARRIVEEDLGVRISKAFRDFEPRPLAAASLGQVHRAVLRDGRPVAVKVQRPGIRDSMKKELEVLGEICAFADAHTEAGRRYGFTDILEQFRTMLMAELDYRSEAANMRALARSMARFDRLMVAEPVEDFTAERVLTMEFVEGRNVGALSPLARMEMQGEELLEQLFRAYLHQALVDGLVHADPHPGNIFLTDDGRLALLDLGMVMHVPPGLQNGLLQTMIAVAEGDGEEVASLAESMGQESREYDRLAFHRAISARVARYASLPLEDLEVGRAFLDLYRIAGRHGLRLPAETSLLGKTLLNLDQVAGILDPHFVPTDAIKRNAASLLRKRALGAVKSGASPGAVFGQILDAKEFVEELPDRVNRALDRVGRGDMEIRVGLRETHRILHVLQQMANRVTMGLVIAALIVGAALLMNVDTTFQIFGYPGLAILLFLAAVGGGGALIVSIVRGDWQERRRGRKDQS